MKSITFTTGEFKEEKTSAWLVAFLKASEKTSVFSLLERVSVKIKKVKYTVRDKLSTLICSIATGCAYTSDVNDRLVPDTVASRMLDMERFPDQSQLNILLNRLACENVDQLRDIHHQLFMEGSTSLTTGQPVVVDIDQTGLIANGKNFELADKGYFPRKRNNRGYQVSAAFCGDSNETLSLYLDSGNTHSQTRLSDILKDVLRKIPPESLIFRMDSAFGSQESIKELKATKARFIVKGYSTVKAKNLAVGVSKTDWEEIDDSIDLFELPSQEGLRYILVRTLQKDASFKYTCLITNMAVKEMTARDLFHFYNGRQTIEAFFKTCKNVYGMKNLRTKTFFGIYGFLWLVFITHNLVSWMQATVFAETEFSTLGIPTIVKKFGTITAEVCEAKEIIEIRLPSLSKLARLFVECIRPKYIQLEIPLLH
jgi:transposase